MLVGGVVGKARAADRRMSAPPPVRVELLWWSGCPSSDEAIELVREEMSAAGLDPGRLEVREVTTEAQALAESFPGSPTIRIDGHDLQPPGEEPVGLTCRVYRRRDGRVSPLPDRGDVRDALERALRRRTPMTEAARLEIGALAPPLELPDTAGELTTLPAPGEAPATVVVWTCNHCPYALAWHDRLLDVARDYGRSGRALPRGQLQRLRSATRTTRSRRCAQRVAAEDWPHPYLHDESQAAALAWGPQTTPDVFVLDSELRLRYRGAPDADYDDPSQGAAWLRAALDAVLAGEAPDPAETEPVGCSIKWKTAV